MGAARTGSGKASRVSRKLQDLVRAAPPMAICGERRWLAGVIKMLMIAVPSIQLKINRNNRHFKLMAVLTAFN